MLWAHSGKKRLLLVGRVTRKLQRRPKWKLNRFCKRSSFSQKVTSMKNQCQVNDNRYPRSRTIGALIKSQSRVNVSRAHRSIKASNTKCRNLVNGARCLKTSRVSSTRSRNRAVIGGSHRLKTDMKGSTKRSLMNPNLCQLM